MGFLSTFKSGTLNVTNVKTDKQPLSIPGTSSPNPYTPRSGSPWTSRPGSMIGTQSLSNGLANDIRCEMMVNWLFQQQMQNIWTTGEPDEGVILKKSPGYYSCCPSDIKDGPFLNAVQYLNTRCAMTIKSRIITLLLQQSNIQGYVPLQDGLRMQVLPDMNALASNACQKHQFAAFIADAQLLVVWDDEPRHLLQRATDIQNQLMSTLWSEQEEGEDFDAEKAIAVGFDEDGSKYGEDAIEIAMRPRRVVLNQAVLSAVTLFFVTFSSGSGFAQIAKEVYLDKNYLRICFVIALPVQMWLALFFFQALTVNVAQVLGPISQVNQNSKTYSGIPSPRLRVGNGRALPHVTVQIPVYKEGLRAVIEPTVHSLKAAISTYEMQGGTANIFINDDCMQLVSEQEGRARQDFYDEHSIGWVARPRHDPRGEHGEPFIRRGKFKKASNMNYALWISNRVEDKLVDVNRPLGFWTQDQETDAYKTAFVKVIEEDQGRTWADGNVRIGDYVLLIDSDTRVPTDCFLDVVSELEQSPQVAIIQMNSGVMNVTNSFFEKGITFFTNLVYTQIRYAVSNGDVAPFVGHNAFLRWSAIQSIGYEEDNREKFWSEATVSEDFDMALRLQSAGFVVRYAAYFGLGFKEGVSLTVYDELARWEKYAYGCNELIFYPLKDWLRHGPFTPLFKSFIRSRIPLPSKITIMAYIGTYYALGSSWLLTLMNYFLIGWFNGWLDHYYIDSFKVYFAIIGKKVSVHVLLKSQC